MPLKLKRTPWPGVRACGLWKNAVTARKAKKPRPKNRFGRTGLKWGGGILILLGLLLAVTWVRQSYRQTSYEISQMRDQYEILQQKQGILKTELERLRSPSRIMQIAREKLDLRDPEPEQIRVIP